MKSHLSSVAENDVFNAVSPPDLYRLMVTRNGLGIVSQVVDRFARRSQR